MSGIFGLLQLDGGEPSPERFQLLTQAMAPWGPDGLHTWQGTVAALGQALLLNTTESSCERLPSWLPELSLAFTAEARLDNRDELCTALGISSAERPTTADGDLLLGAYLKWGEECPSHLIGDWSLAAWHHKERRLFLARDHHGNTALHFHRDTRHHTVAFASSPKALHAIGMPRRLNELMLAQGLISWSEDVGLQTIDLDIQRLPPAHALRLTPEGLRIWRYWRPEDVPELRLARLDDYLEGFLDVYSQAVRARCRSLKPVGVTLSGGLDSGSVTALAGHVLAERGERLAAFTQVPIVDTAQMVGERRFGDETRFARTTAASLSNLDHKLLTSEWITPVQGIERMLAVLGQPTHAASNAFWIADLLDSAQEWGIGTLLTGQGGNATVSWTGAPELRSLVSAFLHAEWKAGVRRALPGRILRTMLGWRRRHPDWSHTAIHPDFARRLDLAGRQIQSICSDRSMPESWRSPRDKRCAIIQPGSCRVGEIWAMQGAASGLEVRDPTFDPRVIEYTLAVPDRFFEAQGGLDRQLIRQAMKGLLPDEVRLNPLRGRQSADLAARLHASATEVETALTEVAAGPAVEYLNLDGMRSAWRDVRDRPSPLSTHRAGAILLRGLMAGLWLNRQHA